MCDFREAVKMEYGFARCSVKPDIQVWPRVETKRLGLQVCRLFLTIPWLESKQMLPDLFSKIMEFPWFMYEWARIVVFPYLGFPLPGGIDIFVSIKLRTI